VTQLQASYGNNSGNLLPFVFLVPVQEGLMEGTRSCCRSESEWKLWLAHCLVQCHRKKAISGASRRLPCYQLVAINFVVAETVDVDEPRPCLLSCSRRVHHGTFCHVFLLLGNKVFKFQGLDALAGGSCEATCLGTETYGICDALHFLSLNSTRALFSTRVNCK
jgi:hypothetical protein